MSSGRLAAVAVVAVAIASAGGCAGALFEPLPKEAQIHHLRTTDGWELQIVRYAAQGEARGRPVLLCHGINSNARNLDLDAKHSLARWLAGHGREVWNLSLRPTGRYLGPDGGDTPLSPVGWDFDSLVDQDIPAAVAYVRSTSGVPLIDYVGHSMGGMVLYGYLGQGGEGIGAAAVLGSPLRLDLGGPLDELMPVAAGVLPRSWILPLKDPSALGSPMEGVIPEGLNERLLYNPRNTSTLSMQRLLAMGMSDVSVGLLQQMAGMYGPDGLRGEGGKRDYRALLKGVTTPVLVVAGKRDRLGMVPSVKAGYAALGGPKEWLLIGVENGAQEDYGHMDLVLGDRAAVEVWPAVLDFLDRHAR